MQSHEVLESSLNYVDCTVTIKDLENVTIEYWEKGVKNFRIGKLGADPFTKMSAERLNYWINFALRYQEQQPPKTPIPCQLADLQVLGLNLYRILFGHNNEGIGGPFTDAFRDFERSKAEKSEDDMRLRLRLVFESEAKELGNLPWEFLAIPADDNEVEHCVFFTGEKTELILTRCIPEPKMIKDKMIKENPKQLPQPKQERLRILVVVSSPLDEDLTARIDEKEVGHVLEDISKVPAADIGNPLRNPTVQALAKAIEERKPHIVHFIGHGREGELALVKAQDDPDFDETQPDEPQPRWVDSRGFKNLFDKYRPRLIFLHACKGAVATSQEGFSSIARELAYAEIPAVVAMQYNISNKDAGKFARIFYQQLAMGRDIDEAVKEGRLELGRSYPGQWNHPRFGTPVVYLQTNIPIVLPMPLEDQKVEQPAPVEELSRAPSRVGASVAAVTTTGEGTAGAQRPTAGPKFADDAASEMR
jgi:hypothetical protein